MFVFYGVPYTDEVFGHSVTRPAVFCTGYHVLIVTQIKDNTAVKVRGASDDEAYMAQEFGDVNNSVTPWRNPVGPDKKSA